MSLLRRMLNAVAGTERRAVNQSGFAHTPGLSAAGYAVSPHLAENLSAVLACISVVSSGLATLPAYVYRLQDGGRVEAPSHPVARLIRAPNPHQTWPDFIEWLMAQVLLRGNALATIEHDGAGRPVALWPIPWQNVQPMILPSGRLAYDVVAWQAPWGGQAMPRRYLAGEVLHLKDRSDDGLIGRSRISRAPDTIGNALALQEWSGAQWANGITPSGAFKVPHKMDQTGMDRLRQQLTEKFAGVGNARKTLILENGMEWQSISVSPEDAEVLDSRKFSIEELARLFGVPPPLIQDYSRNTFTNAATAGLWFAQFTLAPWARKLEAEFSRSLFGASSGSHELTIDLSGLTRGDFAARWASYAIAVDKGILDPAEIRDAEGYNPRAPQPPSL